MLYTVIGVDEKTGKEFTFQEHGTSSGDVRQFMTRSYPWLTITSIKVDWVNK